MYLKSKQLSQVYMLMERKDQWFVVSFPELNSNIIILISPPG